MKTTEHTTLWVCVDCFDAHHFTEHDLGHPLEATAWRLWENEPGDITPGLVGVEHAEDCPVFPVLPNGNRNEFDGSQECECEQEDFSSRPCDGCGSTLGGSREAFTYFGER